MADTTPKGTTALSFTFSAQTLRCILRDGEPWFVAADVCEALTIGNSRDAVARLDDDERADVGITDTSSNGTTQSRNVTIINESGLYSLILTSRKPEAKKFKKWVTAEVLPAIRKTGRYEAPVQPAAHSARERINSRDLMAITRLVGLIGRYFHHDGSWTQGIWRHLRHALGNPAPNPWYVDQLPAIGQHLCRLYLEAGRVRAYIDDVEAQAAKRLLRQGDTADRVLHDMRRAQTALWASESECLNGQLPTWITSHLQAITDRSQPAHYWDASAAEKPEALA